MFLRRAIQNMADRVEFRLNDPDFLDWLGLDPEDINVRGTNALRSATVVASVKILSEAVAKLPRHIYQEQASGAQRRPDHYLQPLLRSRPNPYMTASDMFRMVEAQRNIHGNGYIVPEFIQSGPDRGRIRWLWPVDAQHVEIWIDDRGLFGARNRVWYIVRVGGEEYRLTPDEIIHVKAISLDGIVGVSPLEYLRWLVESEVGGEKHIRDFFRQGLQAKGVIHYTGDLNREAEERFRKRFESMASGLKNFHRVAMLPIGYQFQPLQVSMADAQFREVMESLTIRQIANAFGIKMHQLNDLSRATHTNIEQQQKQFYADTLQAILTAYEEELNYKLFTPSESRVGYYMKFNVDSILRSDLVARYNSYRLGVGGTVLRPNEARALEDLPPVDGGDELYINRAMIPLSMLRKLLEREMGGDADG